MVKLSRQEIEKDIALDDKENIELQAYEADLETIQDEIDEINEYNHDNAWNPEIIIGKYEIAIIKDERKNQYSDTWQSHVLVRDTETNTSNNVYTCLNYKMDISYADEDERLQIKDYEAGITLVANLKTGDNKYTQLEILTEEKMSVAEQFKNKRGVQTKHGTFYRGDGYRLGDFVDNNGNVEKISGDLYSRNGALALTNNSLVHIEYSNFDIQFGSSNGSYVYDLKTKSVLRDLAVVKDLGYHFYGARKKDENKISIYRTDDEEMKTPLLVVDDVYLSSPQGGYSGELRNNTHHVIYKNDGATYKANIEKDEMSPEYNLIPVAKQKDDKLSVFCDGNWLSINIPDNIKVNLNYGNVVEFEEFSKECFLSRKFLHNGQLLKLAKEQQNIQQKETVSKVKESYRNVKEKLAATKPDKETKANETMPTVGIMKTFAERRGNNK